MLAAAKKFNVDKIRQQDLASMARPADGRGVVIGLAPHNYREGGEKRGLKRYWTAMVTVLETALPTWRLSGTALPAGASAGIWAFT